MLISFSDVSKAYRIKGGEVAAVKNVTFEAGGGNVYGLLGPNGSGKTTLMRMLLNLCQPDSGEIWIEGKCFANQSQAFRNRVGYLPEERGFYRNDSVVDVLRYLAELRGLGSRIVRDRVSTSLKRFGLAEHAQSPIGGLSKGMAQKIQVIAAFIHEPDLLILDEPFSGLDPMNVALIRTLIRERKEAGALILLSTHLMDEAEKLCDEIVMLEKGKLILSGSQSELRECNEATEIFVSDQFSGESFVSVERVEKNNKKTQVFLKNSATANDFLLELAKSGESPSRLEIVPMSLERLYIKLIGGFGD